MLTWTSAIEWMAFTSAVAFLLISCRGKKVSTSRRAGGWIDVLKARHFLCLEMNAKSVKPASKSFARFEFFLRSLLPRGFESRKAWFRPPKDSSTVVRWITAVFVLSETGNLFYFASKRNTRTPLGATPGLRRVIPGRPEIHQNYSQSIGPKAIKKIHKMGTDIRC